MKTVGVIFICVMLFFQGFSQQSECPEPEKKAKKLFEQSQDAYNKHNPELAYKLLTEAVREDPNFAKAYIILADVNIQRYNQAQTGNTALQYKNNAINYYCKAADACPSLDNYKACFEAAY
ncbi:MAG: hypothetical protein GYA62_02430, partial [Bacteroidales bacterium]|nr:hypothetical protein [Bacteroidales bacterium]